jgi:hypothetical protein
MTIKYILVFDLGFSYFLVKATLNFSQSRQIKSALIILLLILMAIFIIGDILLINA